MSDLLSCPGSRGGVLRAWLGGLVLLLLSFYALLLSGWFDEITGRIVGDMLSTETVRITIPSIHTDLFWHSSVDTVLVEGPRGLLVRVTGGGARSLLWRQILADVFHAEIVTVNTEEGAAYGAALLAAAGSGAFRSVESACDATIQITGTTSPGKNQSVYNKIYPLYRELYPALRPTFKAIAP